MDRERALALAKKLAAFDSKNATPAEVENAGARLQKIMNEHSLSMMDIKAEQMRGRIKEEGTKHQWKKVPAWVMRFVTDAAHCFRCRTMFFLDTSEVRIIGDETDAALARYFIGAVLGIDLAKMSWRALQVAKKERNLQKHQYHAFHQSFFYGFQKAIVDRLHAEYDQWYKDLDAQQQSQARGLIVIKDNAVGEYLKQQYPNSKSLSVNVRNVTDYAALRKGHEAGMGFALNKGVAGGAGPANKLVS